MSAATEPLTAEEIDLARNFANVCQGLRCAIEIALLKRLCDAAESAAAKDAEIAGLRWSVKYWMESTEQAGKALAEWRERAERAEADAARLSALVAFHEFFKDRCEGLFMQFGFPAITAYNAAAAQPAIADSQPGEVAK